MAWTTRGRLWAVLVGGGSLVIGSGICASTDIVQQKEQKNLLLMRSLCETGQIDKPWLSKQDDIKSTDQYASENALLLEQARSLVQRVKEEKGCPGLAISVSLNGRMVWSEGFGYADVENGVPCKPTTVMRIASISKPLTATAAMMLVEEGKMKLDDPVQKYVPSFPPKQVDSKSCTITVRHLLSHLSGIRHYHKKNTKSNSNSTSEHTAEVWTKEDSEFDRPEYYIKECYDSVEKSMSLFKNDPLVHEPGTEYLYTTFGWTLLSAVIESASKQEFLKHMEGLFDKLGMVQTQAELHGKLIYNRARFYVRDKKGGLKNTPYVDNCYKLAGGGFMSTTEDLIKFGNAMLYSSQAGKYRGISDASLLPGILSPESMNLSWEIVQNTEGKVCKKGGYGLGWILFPDKHEHGCCRHQQKAIFHTGGAVGASSILLLLPDSKESSESGSFKKGLPPRGIVAAILVNMENVSLTQTALEVAELFKNLRRPDRLM